MPQGHDVVVPAGTFVMGLSEESESERDHWLKGSKSPQHIVSIAHPFAAAIMQSHVSSLPLSSAPPTTRIPAVMDFVSKHCNIEWFLEPKRFWAEEARPYLNRQARLSREEIPYQNTVRKLSVRSGSSW